MSLVTGEAVVLDVRTAALPSRMLAAMIDGLIQGAALLALFLTMGLFAGDGSLAAFLAVTVVTIVTVGLGYPVLFETLMNGRTPGKVALGLRVVRDDAGPITFRHAFVRGLIGLLIERPGITTYGAAVLSSLIDPRGRRLGDLAAGTMVIQERVAGPIAPPVPMPPPLAGWASTADLSRVSDDLALSIRSFLARSSALTDAARAQLGGQLTAAVAAVVSPPPPPETPGWAYLSAVLAERRRREEISRGIAPVAQPVNPFQEGYGPTPPSYGEPPATPVEPPPVPAEPMAPVAKKAAPRKKAAAPAKKAGPLAKKATASKKTAAVKKAAPAKKAARRKQSAPPPTSGFEPPA